MHDFRSKAIFVYHKNVKNNKLCCHHMGSFKLKLHENSFSDSLGELMTLPQTL